MVEGTKIYYVCQKGYMLRGQSLRTCTNSQWTGTAPTCEQTSVSGVCPQPQTIEHGDYSFLGEIEGEAAGLLLDGSEVFYSCRTGYRMSDERDEANLVCRNGQWQGELPKCGAFLLQMVCNLCEFQSVGKQQHFRDQFALKNLVHFQS